MMLDFTVCICTYNGASRIAYVFNKLLNQENTEDILWEVIVVDNNSKDDTREVVENYQKNWHKPYSLKYVFEQQQGLGFARQLGVESAQSKLVGFLDDDNIPRQNWVKEAYLFGTSHPQAGAFGSLIHGDFEIPPPENFERISRFLAIGGSSKVFRYNDYSLKKVLPPGAGIVVNKEAWLSSVPKSLFLQGRVTGLKLQGNDIEAFSYIRDSGWEIWHNPKMEIYHKIPKQRLEREYLIQLMKGIGLGRYYTRTLNQRFWQKPFLLILYMVNDFRKLITHVLAYGNLYGTDAVYAAEKEFFIHSLLSPFYIWKNRIEDSRKS